MKKNLIIVILLQIGGEGVYIEHTVKIFYKNISTVFHNITLENINVIIK